MLTQITSRPQYFFTALSQLINQRVPLIDPEDGEKLDHHLNRYRSPIYSAYLYKRRITRDEVYPKIHIIDDVPVEEEPHLKCQTLFPIKNAMDEKTMERLVKEDPSNINSSYIISVFSEDHFKPMIDEYVKKVLVCGKSAKNYEKMNEIEERVKELHKIFYFGEPITQLEREIELKYLSEKQHKFIMHHQIIKEGQKNDFTRCKWREQDQRILEDMVNWRKTDPEVDDTNFRPYYEPLQLLERAATIEKFYSFLGVQNWYDRRKFNRDIKIYYEISEKYYNLLADKIYNRINQYINSVEFTNLLKIPPDFMIEMAMYQIHVWLICERLKTIDTRDTRYLANLIMENFKNTLEIKAATLNVKKENILVRNLHKMLWQNAGVLRFHFTKSNITKDNPYKGIDGLVWSILFFEKVDRYGDEVYLMGDYLIKNYQMMQLYTEQDLMNGLIEFDAYVVDPKYKQIIQAINPPLSKEEFEKEFDSDKLEKKYHYNDVQKGVQIPIDEFKNKKDEMKVTWGEIFSPVRRFFKKYQTLDTMDHYDDIEAQEKKEKKKQESTLWKSKIDEVEETKKEYQNVKDIRKQMHSEKKRNSWSNLKVAEDSKDESKTKK